VKCLLCGGESAPSVRDMVRCGDCGLFQKKELPTIEQMKDGGRGFMLSACGSDEGTARRIGNANRSLDLLERHVPPGKIYDVGAAAGFVMKAAKDRGWTVRGNELSTLAIDWAKKRFDIDIEYGVLEEMRFVDGEFDVVSFWNTLEHMHNPASALMVADMMLRHGGFMYFKVPVKDEHGVQKSYEKLHTVEFSDGALTGHLGRLGYKVVVKELIGKDFFKAMILLARKA